MASDSTSIEDAGDHDSFEAFDIFMERYRDRTWIKAYVDRFEGLTLEGAEGSVHFVNCACGYAGQGPIATRKILVAAGFGDEAIIWRAVSSEGARRRRFDKE